MKNLFNNAIIAVLVLSLAFSPFFSFGAEDEDLKSATAPCEKAALIGAKYGMLADLDLDWQRLLKDSGVLDKTWDLLKENFNATGIGIKLDDIKKGLGLEKINFSKVRNLVGSLFQNKFGRGTQEKAKGIVGSATDRLIEIAGIKKYKDLIGEASDTLGGILSTEVPVQDTSVVAKIEEQKQTLIAEQQRQQIIATTRAQCNDLLKTTTESIKRTLLYQLSTQIMDWIQTGEKPQFIQKPGKFLEDTGRLAVDRFISRVAPRLCEPYRLYVPIYIPSVQREANPFYEQVTCTLDQMGQNLESFYQDFKSGGWVTYNEVLKPQNNFLGEYIAVSDEALRQRQAAIDEAKQAQDRGFTSQKECTLWKKYESTPGEEASGDIQYVGGVGMFSLVYGQGGTVGSTQDGSPPEIGLQKDPQNRPIEKGTRFWASNNNYFWECMADKITSPATIAAGLSERASQTELDYLANTSDIENFLATIEDAIINKLVKSGVKAFRNILPKILP